jgi:hypothetical protein
MGNRNSNENECTVVVVCVGVIVVKEHDLKAVSRRYISRRLMNVCP